MKTLTFAVALCFPVVVAAETHHEVQPPNIVFIISDDQAWTDYGFMGHPHIETPRLDQLAAESLVYTRGYVTAPLCRASLASMVTGVHPIQHRIRGNDPVLPSGQHRRQAPDEFKAGRETMTAPLHDQPSMVKLLREQGYLTLQTGKWWEQDPKDHGFTHAMTHGDEDRGGRHGDAGLEIGRTTQSPYTDFIDEAIAAEKPFFVWYGVFLPHTPHNAREDLFQKYQEVAPNEPTARYWANVEWFDEACGEVLDALDERGIADNTVVIYVTDNGWIPDPERVNRFTRSKQEPYEAGIRTPIMIHWPDHVEPEQNDTTLVSMIDATATMLNLAGIEPPAPMAGLDLRDAAALDARNMVIVEDYAHDSDLTNLDDPTNNLDSRVLIRGWDKIIAWSDRTELYDLKTDVADEHDLAALHPEKVRDMAQQLNDWVQTHSSDQP